MRRGLILSGLMVLLLAGCSSSSFVGRRVDNFTAYYNKYYNAHKAFQRGVKALEKQDQPINRDQYLPVFGATTTATTSKDFDDSVKKSADVLRAHAGSKWVDNSLLLIGKAYFYQANYVGAEQKFREIVGLNSSLADEARFWIARTLIASEDYERAAEHLAESLNRDDIHRRWESMLHLALGELYVKRGQWEDAVTELELGLKRVPDNDIGARGQFLLGQVYETLGKPDEAVAAYKAVRKYHPLFELTYASQINEIRIMGSNGEAEAALKELRSLKRNNKYYNNRAELEYLEGLVLLEAKQHEDAFFTFDRLLYDFDGDVSKIRGRSHYALAEIYRDFYHDYELASAHFDTAATALKSTLSTGNGPRTQSTLTDPNLFTKSAITDFDKQAEMFRSFAKTRSEINQMDSLLHLGSLPEEEFKTVIHELRQQRARELEAQRKEAARRQAEQGFSDSNLDTGDRQDYVSSTETDASSGFLFHQNASRVQDGWMGFVDRWGERPLVPNWRRREALNEAAASARRNNTNGNKEAEATQNGNDEFMLPVVDISNVPRTPENQKKMRAQRAAARYELGNVLFLAMSRPDSAASWYRMVIEEDGDEPIAQRAYYALAEVQQSLGDSLSSRRLYEQILRDYPGSDFADIIRERLGMPVQKIISDSLKLAEQAYNKAYAMWKQGAYEQAVHDMMLVAVQYPTTAYCPRALLAAGSIYTEWATRDSLDLFEEIPASIPDSLLLASSIKWKFDADKIEVKPAGGAIGPPSGVVTPADSSQADLAIQSLATESTVVVNADSSLHIPVPDSTILAGIAPDTSRVAGGNLPSDTTAVAPEIPVDPHVNLEVLYASLADTYPQTPFADRANRLLKALQEKKPKPAALPDSTAALKTDTAGAANSADIDIPVPDTLQATPDMPITEPGVEAVPGERVGGNESDPADTTTTNPENPTGTIPTPKLENPGQEIPPAVVPPDSTGTTPVRKKRRTEVL